MRAQIRALLTAVQVQVGAAFEGRLHYSSVDAPTNALQYDAYIPALLRCLEIVASAKNNLFAVVYVHGHLSRSKQHY